MAKLKPEDAEAIQNLVKAFGQPQAQTTSFSIDLYSTFVVLAAVAMCVGKSPMEIKYADVKKTAFGLANMLFKPDGTLND